MADECIFEGPQSIDEGFPGLPSFVRQVRESDEAETTLECFDHWAPQVATGCPAFDYAMGGEYCRAAMSYARTVGGVRFLLFVLVTIKDRGALGDIERGFIAELAGKVLKGAIPEPVESSVLDCIQDQQPDIGAMREHEALMGHAIGHCRDKPELFLSYVLGTFSGQQGQWVGPAILLLAGAALNGGLH
jgi:hypothetical protein